jgi:hypothetical protein
MFRGLQIRPYGQIKMDDIENETAPFGVTDDKTLKIIKEIITLERAYYFERKNVRSERQNKVKDIIERHVSIDQEVEE